MLKAISVIEKNLSSPEATEAAKTIVIYAQVSEDVLVDIGPEQLPWLDEDWGMAKDREQACKSPPPCRVCRRRRPVPDQE